MRAFLDTNVLLDVLAERMPFYEHSSAVWSLAENGTIEGLVSAFSFTTVFYIVRKWGTADVARDALLALREVFAPAGCDATVINRAIDSELGDFEDAVQYFTAIRAEVDCLLTRDPDDFPRRPAIPVLSPREFLAHLDERYSP